MHEPLYEEMHRMEQRHWWFVARRRILCELVDRYVGRGRKLRICELGCGTGGNLLAWSDQHQVIGIDPSEVAVRIARRKVPGRIVRGRLPSDVPVASNSCDVVLLADVLEHIADDFASIRAAWQLVRPGGILLATVPAHPWLYSPRDAYHQHMRRYTQSRFRSLLTLPGGTNELLSYYNSWLFPAAAAVRLYAKLRGESAAGCDLRIPPWPINQMLAGLFASERHLLGRVPLPPGLSLIGVVRRCGHPAADQSNKLQPLTAYSSTSIRLTTRVPSHTARTTS